MRLDKFLKVSRLIKRRTVANDVSDQGRVLINGLPAKPAKQLKVGDKITIVYAGGETIVEILTVPSGNVSVQEAPNLYKVISDFRRENK
jgi:ribosomal 50S subunit-recycling heat shock protein